MYSNHQDNAELINLRKENSRLKNELETSNRVLHEVVTAKIDDTKPLTDENNKLKVMIEKSEVVINKLKEELKNVKVNKDDTVMINKLNEELKHTKASKIDLESKYSYLQSVSESMTSQVVALSKSVDEKTELVKERSATIIEKNRLIMEQKAEILELKKEIDILQFKDKEECRECERLRNLIDDKDVTKRELWDLEDCVKALTFKNEKLTEALDNKIVTVNSYIELGKSLTFKNEELTKVLDESTKALDELTKEIDTKNLEIQRLKESTLIKGPVVLNDWIDNQPKISGKDMIVLTNWIDDNRFPERSAILTGIVLSDKVCDNESTINVMRKLPNITDVRIITLIKEICEAITYDKEKTIH